MNICMNIRMYICMYENIYYVYFCVRMYVWINLCVFYVRNDVCTRTCSYAFTCLYVVCTYMWIYIYVCIYMDVCVCMFVCIYVCTY